MESTQEKFLLRPAPKRVMYVLMYVELSSQIQAEFDALYGDMEYEAECAFATHRAYELDKRRAYDKEYRLAHPDIGKRKWQRTISDSDRHARLKAYRRAHERRNTNWWDNVRSDPKRHEEHKRKCRERYYSKRKVSTGRKRYEYRHVLIDGVIMSVPDACRAKGMHYPTVKSRICHGWDILRAICEPIRKKRRPT